MNSDITIYGAGGNRAARVVWTVNELGLGVTYRHYDGMIGSDELRQFHPQAKVPAAQINGLALFESAAICQHLCDITAGNTLLAASGTNARSLHAQWVLFAQSEIEAYLWHNFQLGRIDPDNELSQLARTVNLELAEAGQRVLEQHLSARPFLLGDTFTLADIIVGWTVNWGRKAGLLEARPELQEYLSRLFARPQTALQW